MGKDARRDAWLALLLRFEIALIRRRYRRAHDAPRASRRPRLLLLLRSLQDLLLDSQARAREEERVAPRLGREPPLLALRERKLGRSGCRSCVCGAILVARGAR